MQSRGRPESRRGLNDNKYYEPFLLMARKALVKQVTNKESYSSIKVSKHRTMYLCWVYLLLPVTVSGKYVLVRQGNQVEGDLLRKGGDIPCSSHALAKEGKMLFRVFLGDMGCQVKQ